MLQETLRLAPIQKPVLENSVWYNGHTFSFLLNSELTAGAFALIHCYFRKGGEPPAHYHRIEYETFYILEGEVRFHVGDKKFSAKPGETVLIPKETPHQFSLVTETARALLLITPGGMESFFKEFGMPAQSLELPPVREGQPPADFFEKMMKRATELGMVWMPEF